MSCVWSEQQNRRRACSSDPTPTTHLRRSTRKGLVVPCLIKCGQTPFDLVYQSRQRSWICIAVVCLWARNQLYRRLRVRPCLNLVEHQMQSDIPLRQAISSQIEAMVKARHTSAHFVGRPCPDECHRLLPIVAQLPFVRPLSMSVNSSPSRSSCILFYCRLFIHSLHVQHYIHLHRSVHQ